MIAIKRKGVTLAMVQPEVNVEQQMEISSIDLVQLTFSLPYFVRFRIEDYIDVFGQRYYVTTRPIWTKVYTRNYTYELNLEGEQYKLGRVRCRQVNSLNQYFNNPFFINDKLETMAILVLNNMQRVFPDDGWNLGYVEETEVKNVQFDSMNCLEVINHLATTFETEWLIEGRTIHIFRKTNAVNHVFKVGENEALLSLTEKPLDNSNKVNRLYVYGGSKNLPVNYRNGRTRLNIGDKPYIEGDTSEGVWEDDVTFDNIFPINDGVVTGVDSGNPLKFTDSNIPFNVNDHLQDSVTAKVAFEGDSQLSGYEFDINNYNHSTKTFTINKNTKESAIDIPSEMFRPKVGDKYFVFDIRMPGELTAIAEGKLRQKGQDKMDDGNNVENNLLYSVVCNPLYFKRKGIVLKLGDSIIIQDEDTGVNTSKRIVRLTRNLREPNMYTAELANKVKDNKLVKLLSRI